MLNADRASRFIEQIESTDLGLFLLSLVTITLTVKGVRKIADWLTKRFASQKMMIFGWVPVFNFLLYFSGTLGSFYIIFEPSREFLIGFMLSGFVAIGFAIKDIAASIIAGIILLVDKPFQVGDRVTFQGHYGDITRIGLRSVKLLTLDESVVTIPNQRFISDVVSSSSAGELGMMAAVDVHVSLEADLYKIEKILKSECKKNKLINGGGKIIVVGKEILGINGNVSFKMTLKCILKDAQLEKAFQTNFLMSVNKAFKANDIKLLS